jgi:hypothetical protein
MSSDHSNEYPPPDPDQPEGSGPGGSNPQPGEGGQPGQDEQGNQISQEVRHQQVAARVPESVGRGTFASGALVLTGSHEFIVDFIQSVAQPRQVAQRVILPPSILNNTINAIQKNIDNYHNRFGEIPELPKNQQQQNQQPPSIEEIYQQLKLPDEVASGVYANTVLITHGQTEFCFDFITSFYPRSTVAARIYMAAPQVPRLLQTLTRSFEQFKQRIAAQQQQQQQQQSGQPGADASADPGSESTGESGENSSEPGSGGTEGPESGWDDDPDGPASPFPPDKPRDA